MEYIKITICDDSLNDLSETERLLKNYIRNKDNVKFIIDKCKASSDLFDKISNSVLSDIYILDILMPDKSGIDIGELIRKNNKDCYIIYTTSSKEFAYEAYGVKAIRYLIKPLKSEDLVEAVDYILSSRKAAKEKNFLVKTHDGIISVPISKINYIENISRTMRLFLTDKKEIKSLIIRSSFENEANELLCSDNFIQVHKSFIVNMDYIEKLSQDNLIVKNNIFIPISKKKKNDVKNRYLKYLTDQYKK